MLRYPNSQRFTLRHRMDLPASTIEEPEKKSAEIDKINNTESMIKKARVTEEPPTRAL